MRCFFQECLSRPTEIDFWKQKARIIIQMSNQVQWSYHHTGTFLFTNSSSCCIQVSQISTFLVLYMLLLLFSKAFKKSKVVHYLKIVIVIHHVLKWTWNNPRKNTQIIFQRVYKTWKYYLYKDSFNLETLFCFFVFFGQCYVVTLFLKIM